MPQAQADVEGPSGVVPFVADLRDSLRGMGLEAELPPIVYETVRGGADRGTKQGMAGLAGFATALDLMGRAGIAGSSLCIRCWCACCLWLACWPVCQDSCCCT